MRITRHFVEIEGRRVHYRRTGHGPAIVLIHASPVSSRVMEPFMHTLADIGTVFAFDTPGNGLSQALALDQPATMADFADALAETFRALGIESAMLYGRHTGASIAVEFAVRHPAMVSGVLTDGYPWFTAAQASAYLSDYLEDLRCAWDGSHLLWLWFRYRDQHVFWPWNAMDAAHRADTDVPDSAFIHRGVIELLEAGNHYQSSYAAVFRHEGLQALQRSTRPVCLAARPGDSLYRKWKLLPDDGWKVEMPREAVAAMQAERAIMLAHRPRELHSVREGTQPMTGWRYLILDDRQIFVMAMGVEHDKSLPLVVIGPQPGSIEPFEAALRSIADVRPVYAIDLPGCGNSDEADTDTGLWERQTAVAARAIAALGLPRFDLLGIAGGAWIALRLADDAQRCLLLDPPVLSVAQREAFGARLGEPIGVRWDGAHLLSLWHQERDRRLWFPFFERTRNAARAQPDVTPDEIHRHVRSLVKHPASYAPLWNAVGSFDWQSALGRVRTTPAFFFSRSSCLPVEQAVDTVLAAGHTATPLPCTLDEALVHVGRGASAEHSISMHPATPEA
jgi:pimeloyl-ACP methyl ester carboxylesterase